MQPESNPRGLNAYNSLNQANRIIEKRKVITDNVSILNRLQNAQSHYSVQGWEKEFTKNKKTNTNIRRNADRFCKHPYFVHSITTADMVPY